MLLHTICLVKIQKRVFVFCEICCLIEIWIARVANCFTSLLENDTWTFHFITCTIWCTFQFCNTFAHLKYYSKDWIKVLTCSICYLTNYKAWIFKVKGERFIFSVKSFQYFLKILFSLNFWWNYLLSSLKVSSCDCSWFELGREVLGWLRRATIEV